MTPRAGHVGGWVGWATVAAALAPHQDRSASQITSPAMPAPRVPAAPPGPPAVPLFWGEGGAPAAGQAARQPHRLRQAHRGGGSLHSVSGGCSAQPCTQRAAARLIISNSVCAGRGWQERQRCRHSHPPTLTCPLPALPPPQHLQGILGRALGRRLRRHFPPVARWQHADAAHRHGAAVQRHPHAVQVSRPGCPHGAAGALLCCAGWQLASMPVGLTWPAASCFGFAGLCSIACTSEVPPRLAHPAAPQPPLPCGRPTSAAYQCWPPALCHSPPPLYILLP